MRSIPASVTEYVSEDRRDEKSAYIRALEESEHVYENEVGKRQEANHEGVT